MSKTAVVINEFGEIGIDNDLVEKSGEDVVLMSSGCLCCTVRGDLVETLRSLYIRRAKNELPPFERVVVETTGLADPAPILHTLMADPFLVTRYRLDGVIATVDAVNGAGTLDRHAEAVKQAAVADRLVLTKPDLADTDQQASLTQRLARLNPGAPVRPVVAGEVDPAVLFDAGLFDPKRKTVDVQRWLNEEAYAEHEHVHHHEHGQGHDHGHAHRHGAGAAQDPHDVNRHDAHIRAFCMTYDKPFAWSTVATWLELLATYRGDDLLRVKGILNVAEAPGPIVIHGVQHLFHPPVALPSWPSADHRSRLVFITRDMDRATIESMLTALDRPAERGESGA
jgi:G3E family GTPase